MINEMPITIPVIVLVGPTAVGKTALSIQIASTFNCEVISMDSMQVYRYMDIGTAKVTDEEKSGIPHHLIDIRNPNEQYDAASFVQDTLNLIKSIKKRGAIPFITGGTGLYLKALIQGLFPEPVIDQTVREKLKRQLEKEGREVLHQKLLRVDPASAKRIHINDSQRLVRALEIYESSGTPWSVLLTHQHQKTIKRHFSNMLQIGLYREREALYKRINQRSKMMFDNGLVEEVRQLRNMGYDDELPSMQSIGYRHANKILDNNGTLESTISDLARDTRHYAKRQLTWFRSNKDIVWCDAGENSTINGKVRSFFDNL